MLLAFQANNFADVLGLIVVVVSLLAKVVLGVSLTKKNIENNGERWFCVSINLITLSIDGREEVQKI